ncbi:MAG: hypothetical protein V5A59_07060 [Bacteroidales bacterium]
MSQESSRSDYVEQLSGPRIGVTYVRGEAAEKLREDFDAVPIVSQFGWQLEWRFFSMEDGPDGVVEFVPLVGGVEQNLFLPSLNFLIGLRSPKGTEAGIGPNLSPTGASLVLAVGFTAQAGKLNIPFNLAFVPSQKGARFTLLIGFNK